MTEILTIDCGQNDVLPKRAKHKKMETCDKILIHIILKGNECIMLHIFLNLMLV